MSAQKPELTFLDFDGTYEEQTELCVRFPHHWVDFRTLRQASLYCTLESFRAIERKLAGEAPQPRVTLIGCGNYHFVTLALLERLRRPFALVLVDRHTDSKESLVENMISCGSWIRHALRRVKLLKRVVMVGQPPEAIASLPQELRRRIFYLPDLSEAEVSRFFATLPDQDVYLSIDKDALDSAVARTNWDHGSLRLKDLQSFIARFAERRRLCGADICGELPASPLDLLRPEIRSAIGRNERTNEVLLDALLNAG